MLQINMFFHIRTKYGFYSRILYDTERDVFTLERVPVEKG